MTGRDVGGMPWQGATSHMLQGRGHWAFHITTHHNSHIIPGIKTPLKMVGKNALFEADKCS